MKDADEDDFSTVFYFNLAGSLFIYAVVFFAAPLIADFYDQGSLVMIIRVYCTTFIINAFSTIQITRLVQKLDFKTELKVTIPSLILGSLSGIILAYKGYGVWSLVWSGVIQSLAASAHIWMLTKWRPLLSFNREKFRYHFRFGVKLTLSGIIDTVFSNAYPIIIGKFFAPAQVGYFNRADTLKQVPVSNISAILHKVTYPLFAAIHDDEIRLKSVYRKIMQLVIFLLAPTLIFMAILGEPLFRFLFTEKWLPAVPYFQIICATGILYPIHAYNLNILNVKGRSDLFLKLEIIKKIVMTIIILISFRFGIFGLLYGSIVSSIIALFINSYYSGKYINYPALEQLKDLLPIIIVAFLAAFSAFHLCSRFLPATASDWITILCVSLCGGVIYLGLAFILKMSSLFEILQLLKIK